MGAVVEVTLMEILCESARVERRETAKTGGETGVAEERAVFDNRHPYRDGEEGFATLPKKLNASDYVRASCRELQG